MSGTWWTRFLIIVGTLFAAIYFVMPTLIVDEAAELKRKADSANSGVAAEDVEDDRPWYIQLLPDAKIQRGIDIQGGIDLTLQVEVDEAILSSVQRDIKPVRDGAARDGLTLDDVRRARGESTLLIRGGTGVALGDITAFINEKYRDIYVYDSTRNVDGNEYHAYIMAEERKQQIREQAVEQALETLRNRIDETGVKEPSIVRKGDNQINVQLPGAVDEQQALQAIGTTAVLEFMMVDEEAMEQQGSLTRALANAETALTADSDANGEADYLDDEVLDQWLHDNNHLQRGQRLLWEYEETESGKKRAEANRYGPGWTIVKDEVILTGDDVNDANVGFDPRTNQPEVSLSFKPRGARIFDQVTAENVGRRFAIVLDSQVRSAPNIRERISGGTASISMGTQDMLSARNEASVLALVLRTGSLPAPVTVGNIKVVGPTLGADAIEAGRTATLVGFGLVLVFMVLFYKKAGFISVAALLCNVLFVMALLAIAGATLTLPGIAGIALTIGMAVDANIIIYERIREELRLGKNARSAAEAGFGKALWAVLDANITTFIAGVVLYTYGTGPIKGFAVTLMIGIITTLYTGIFVSRTLMDFLTRKASTRLSI
jgi:protein-export membrane protein SecD